MKTNSRRASQRGSALLIVLVFAAMLAILLYREMPVAAFEAERQKEELLMDRGNEYSRAVKLYVRKFQTFPPSMEALENTNRMRFLRNRYVDPYTGKDDWRVLHAGPGGVILDSKIKQNTPGLPGAPGSISSTPTGAPASVSNVFANSFDGANPNGQPAVAGSSFPQRPPAIVANGGGAGVGNNDGVPQDAQNPLIPYPGYPGPQTSGLPGQTGNSMPDPSQYGGQPANPPGSGPSPGRFGGMNPTGNSYSPGQFGDGVPSVGAPPQNPQSAMQSLLNTQNPPPTVQNGATNSSASPSGAFGSNVAASGLGSQPGAMGNGMGNGIAGVASKAPGHTIKTLNDQTDRSLWEFVYDMQKEAQANATGLGNSANGAAANNPNGGMNNGGMNGSQPGQPNSFGSSFGQSSTFGNTPTISPSPTQPNQPIIPPPNQ